MAASGPSCRRSTSRGRRQARGQQLHNLHLRAQQGRESTDEQQGHSFPSTRSTSSSERWPKERLALAHLDVEGDELSALRGAERIIARDQPFLLTELTVHRDAAYTRSLLGWLHERGYDTFLIEEHTGYPRMDIRNVLSLPRSRRGQWVSSNALDLALAARVLHPVDATTILSHAFPCCRAGGECCKDSFRCCLPRDVRLWVTQATREWLALNKTEERLETNQGRVDPRLFTLRLRACRTRRGTARLA